MDLQLKGKTVLIAGASRNMGRVAALEFAKEGANLCLCTSTKMKDLNQVAEEARGLGAKVLAEQCDITSEASVSSLVKKAREQLGGVDVAISLAGYRAEGSILDMDVETWRRTIDVNLTGPFFIARHVAPLMKERRWGRFINVSGIAPYLGQGAAKAMVKLGIVGFTRGIAREFGPYNITANCVAPGGVERGKEHGVGAAGGIATGCVPTKGTAQEVAQLVLYLASEQAAHITGQCHLINGGMYMH